MIKLIRSNSSLKIYLNFFLLISDEKSELKRYLNKKLWKKWKKWKPMAAAHPVLALLRTVRASECACVCAH